MTLVLYPLTEHQARHTAYGRVEVTGNTANGSCPTGLLAGRAGHRCEVLCPSRKCTCLRKLCVGTNISRFGRYLNPIARAASALPVSGNRRRR